MPTPWENWTASLSPLAAKLQRRYAFGTPAAVGYHLIVFDELEVSPRVEAHASFEQLTAALRALPETCYAIPVYGAILPVLKADTDYGLSRYIVHPSGQLEPLTRAPARLSPDFFVGRGPADLLESEAALQRALPRMEVAVPGQFPNTVADMPPLSFEDDADDFDGWELPATTGDAADDEAGDDEADEADEADDTAETPDDSADSDDAAAN